MVSRVNGTNGVYGSYGDDNPPNSVGGNDPKTIKVFNFEQNENIDRRIVAAKNKIELIKGTPHTKKELLKACSKDEELFNKLVEKGYIKETPDGEFMVTGLVNAYTNVANEKSGYNIEVNVAKALLLDLLAPIKEDEVSAKQAKKLAKFCGLNVVGNSKIDYGKFFLDIGGMGSMLNTEEITPKRE